MRHANRPSRYDYATDAKERCFPDASRKEYRASHISFVRFVSTEKTMRRRRNLHRTIETNDSFDYRETIPTC